MMTCFKKKIVNETRDYKRFDLHELNRNIDKSKKNYKNLVRSMERHGWWDFKPMCVNENGSGRFKIKSGHHRFVAAMDLGIPVKFIISDMEVPLPEIEEFNPVWGLRAFLDGYSKQGRPDYIEVKRFHEKTGIGIMNCISILGGQTAGTTYKNEAFKRGRFTLGNLSNAQAVADIVACLQHNGVDYATNSNFVKAISMVVWVNGFSVNELKKKISRHRALITRQPTRDTYLKMLEEVYNRQRKDKIPLEFMAKEASRLRRQAVFGPKKTARRGNLAAVRK